MRGCYVFAYIEKIIKSCFLNRYGGDFGDSSYLRCVNCGAVYASNFRLYRCPKCGGLLDVVVRDKYWAPKGRGVWRYASMLPLKNGVSLGEGMTPLVKSNLGENLYIKFEGANPTGSFKDRGMALGVTIAKESGASKVVVASTGNTAASAAAYAARAGLKCYVVLPRGNVARGKLIQAALHGAELVMVSGLFDKALEYVVTYGTKYAYPLNSFNPWRLEGQKTLAFEIYEELGCPDYVIVPVGNAGNISAIWKGFKELGELGLCKKLPKMVGVQAEGAAPLATAWQKGLKTPFFIDEPETVATAIKIGKPINWPKAMAAVRESEGFFTTVSDGEILKAQKLLASKDGVGSEPAGAASVAAALKLKLSGTVVAVVTGHALKDPDVVEINAKEVRNAEELVELLER
ncbi:L-threonine synthase [Pyrobaculum islandicum DSM 4184]|uniref:Threonine synthase n=1 Tax=Pyrobaculum islandicum (strain DSM 4184 / JCM 9189 / GEO3) TaxID=384616 RepID=A1RR71_PYRIL|nr:L-threonine synthase [Pyrobaculum islandicum DSM 4184]